MVGVGGDYGTPNPNAPKELSQFAFLIGAWRGEARLLQEGRWTTLDASWEGRYILDGYAIADEYRMMSPSGELLVLGLDLRAYDESRKAWNLKWLDALTGRWTDLGPEELGGVDVEREAISYRIREPVAGHALTRATYTDISADHFTWRGERSDDGSAWETFLVVDLRFVPTPGVTAKPTD